MNDVETQALELLRHRDWISALGLFDQLLSVAFSKVTPKERIVSYLLGRSECSLELGRHEAVVLDCRRIIKLVGAIDNNNNNGARARRRLVHALFTLHRFTEAEAAATEWIASSGGITSTNPEATKMLERVRLVIQMSNGPRNQRGLHLQPRAEDDILSSDCRLESWFGSELDDRSRRNRKHPVELIEPNDHDSRDEALTDLIQINHNLNILNMHSAGCSTSNGFQSQIDNVGCVRGAIGTAEQPSKAQGYACTYCCLAFGDRGGLRAHCQSEGHQRVIMSDEGRDWRWRPPPRGLSAENYSLCEHWAEGGSGCRYGAQCVEAHSQEELGEWRERFEYRRMKLQRACEKELYGKSYTEQLLERWVEAASPDRVMRERVPGVEDLVNDDLVTTVSSKVSKREWQFTLHTSRTLRAVALLQDAHRNHFILRHVSCTTAKGQPLVDQQPPNDQEWVPGVADNGAAEPGDTPAPALIHTVRVAFATDIYGTFRQSVVFDFGQDPVLVKHLCVDVIPVTDADKIKEIKKGLVLSSVERWDSENVEMVSFSSPVVASGGTVDTERERELLAAYPAPRSDTFALTQSTVVEKRLTRNNYRARSHQLLAVEEMARYEQVARYNLKTRLQLANCYLLSPSGVAASTAKYAHNGELFALMTLGKDISEDTSAGRLILNNCTTVLLAPGKSDVDEKPASKRVVYESLIEDKGKNVIYLRLSAATVQALQLKVDTEFEMDVQFQLNRIPYCEWHHAIDKIADFRVIFPETYLEPSIPWSPQRSPDIVNGQWNESLDTKLNLKQKEAVVAITTPVNITLPPILIIGPFGTGKTYTLAQAIKQVLFQPDTRILVCTHSNSAADLYIKDYLHPYVEAGHMEAKPLRIYYHKRWVATVNQIVQKYCLIESVGGMRQFKVPTLEDILKHRVIVVTLSISMYLSTIGLHKGHFTHILLDEAAQAMECEAIMPLALANDDTRIVLAGDHMQLSPELFSQFAKERHLHVSLLERLYDHYPTTFPCKILLCENYRAHEAIIQFTSELFYDQKLISSGNQPQHDQFYPLTFFTTRGEDVQDRNSTAFYNNSEVYEVVERVCELKRYWPSTWGKQDEHSIGIMTPYADQVFRIRSELRKRRMGNISVERVLNVQGKQFRAIFLSTVRTRRTCSSGNKSTDDMDYGFLSNSKLLNTAITRAQSLVAVVGDPVALCSIGRCRKVWERFIEICDINGSLYGIKWTYLRSQLDGVELKKTYTLNPLAPEFVPRQFQPETYIRIPSLLGPGPYNGQQSMRFPPPYLPPAGSVYPVPTAVYYPYHPGQAPPPGTSFYPVPPRPVVYPAPNTWGYHPPMVSPTNGMACSKIWIKKNSDVSPPLRRDEMRPPPGLLPPPPPQQRNPFPPIQRPSPPSPNMDGFLSHNAFVRAPQQPAPAHYVAQKAVLEPRRPAMDKQEHFQFLHNVHFPERQVTNFAHLLPPDVSLAEMFESHQKQIEWYAHLMDSVGLETATKFMELMSLGPLSHNRTLGPPPQALPDMIHSLQDIFMPDKLNFHPQHNAHLPPPQMNQFLDGMMGMSTTWYSGGDKGSDKLGQQVGEVLLEPPQQLMRRVEERYDLVNSWAPAPSHHTSVPLYRRQPLPPQGVENGLSVEEKVVTNGTSGAFAGYAHAAVNYHHHRSDDEARDQDSGDELLANIQRQTTYASVVRTTQHKSEERCPSADEKGDPFAVLRELGSKPSGLYHYFS